MEAPTSNIFTEDDYLKILRSKFHDTADDIKFVKAELTPFFQHMEGFLGEHYLLKVDYKIGGNAQSADFFVKTKPQTPFQRQMVDYLSVFEKEIFFYNDMTKTFKDMGCNIDFAPKCYYIKDNSIIVLENLRNRGFKLFPRGNFYDMTHCKLALNAIAHFHANFIAYEEKKSLELGKAFKLIEEKPELTKDFFYNQEGNMAPGIQFMQTTIQLFTVFSKLLPESEEWKNTFENNLKAFDIVKTFYTPFPYRKSCCHGDLWSNNILFKYTNEIPDQCYLIDYQLLRYHHLSFDALLILYANTGREFRKKHLDELLNYHYDTFADILKKYGYEAERLLPKEHYMKSAKALAVVACVQFAGGRTMILLPKELMDMAKSPEFDEAMMIEKGGQIATEYFMHNERYKKIVSDDIYDMYEHFIEAKKQ